MEKKREKKIHVRRTSKGVRARLATDREFLVDPYGVSVCGMCIGVTRGIYDVWEKKKERQ